MPCPGARPCNCMPQPVSIEYNWQWHSECARLAWAPGVLTLTPSWCPHPSDLTKRAAKETQASSRTARASSRTARASSRMADGIGTSQSRQRYASVQLSRRMSLDCCAVALKSCSRTRYRCRSFRCDSDLGKISSMLRVHYSVCMQKITCSARDPRYSEVQQWRGMAFRVLLCSRSESILDRFTLFLLH